MLSWLLEVWDPSNVTILGWRFLLDCLPTREQLYHRNIIRYLNEINCLFYEAKSEYLSHRFYGCPVINNIWKKVG